MKQIFKAGVSYGDFKGSVAADEADSSGLHEWLKNRQLISDDEYILGIEMAIGENHGVHQDPVYVSFFMSDLKGHNDIPEMLNSCGDSVELTKKDVQMDLAEFFGLFKRFNVTLSRRAGLEGKTIIYQ